MKHVFPLNKRFRQIIKLSRLCDKHNIPYDMRRFMDGWALSIPNNESELCCVTQHSFSEGGKKNLLEIEFYIGGYESKGNQSAEEILSQLRKVQKYEDTKKRGMHRIQKYFASDDETMVTRDYEILKEYLDFRKENDEWFVVQIKDLGAVGIPNLPLFFPSWCNNITIKKDGYTQKVENIDWTVKENGQYLSNTCILSIKDDEGKEIYKQPAEKQVYRPEAADEMKDILSKVLVEGTGKDIQWYNYSDIKAYGKTGTTNSSKDGWFCGFTDDYTISVWIGKDNHKDIEGLYGGTYPAEIWKEAMLSMYE